jgi:hypothetical protein
MVARRGAVTVLVFVAVVVLGGGALVVAGAHGERPELGGRFGCSVSALAVGE